MPVEKINLRKLLQLFFAGDRLQRSLLLADIRSDRAKEEGKNGSGGDFYTPFWADVKDHAAGRSDLNEQTKIRISKNKTRARLYPILSQSFLSMWTETMRWRNEPFEFLPESVKTQFSITELGTVVKIENTAAVKIWDGSHRVIYPYFYESPALGETGARLGFWALRQGLPAYKSDEFRIVDMLRKAYYRAGEVGESGNEKQEFLARYDAQKMAETA